MDGKLRAFLSLVFLPLGVMLTACDSPTDTGDHPAGVIFLRADGTEAARFIYGGPATGGLQVAVGAPARYTVRVLTESGQVVAIDGIEHSIGSPGVVITSLATIAVEDSDKLRLQGLVTGTTSIRFDLIHVGHTEFQVAGVPLVVQ